MEVPMETKQDSFISEFKRLAKCAYTNAAEKGFHDTLRPFPTACMLVVTEIAEAVEGDRKNLQDDKVPQFSAREAELADAVIRILDMSVEYDLRVAEAILVKMAFNTTRERLHGGKAY